MMLANNIKLMFHYPKGIVSNYCYNNMFMLNVRITWLIDLLIEHTYCYNNMFMLIVKIHQHELDLYRLQRVI